MIFASAETQKLVKMYAKEGYRQVAYYTKRGLRSAATGFTIARAIANKLDIAGERLDFSGRARRSRHCTMPMEHAFVRRNENLLHRLGKAKEGNR